MIGSFLAPKWPIMVLFCGMDHQKSNFSLISDTLSVRGCWGQPMLLFWKLVDETQMVKPLEPTIHHNSKKYLILLPLRAIYFRSFHYETPCTEWHIFLVNTLYHIQLSSWTHSMHVDYITGAAEAFQIWVWKQIGYFHKVEIISEQR